MKPISTKMHGVLDYTTAAGLLMLPKLLGWDKDTTRLLTGSALGTVGYSLLTRYELGLFKLLPMKGHLTLDVMQSLLLAAAPLAFMNNVRRAVAAGLVGISLFEALVVLNSESETSGPANEGRQSRGYSPVSKTWKQDYRAIRPEPSGFSARSQPGFPAQPARL